MLPIICTKCNGDVEIDARIEVLPGGIERVYIRCPNCRADYTSHYANAEIKALQAEQRALQDRIVQIRQSDMPEDVKQAKVEKAMKRFERGKREIKRKMDALRSQFE